MMLSLSWPLSESQTARLPQRVEYQLRDDRLEVDVADACDVPFETCEPVRAFPTWPGKRHYSGLFFMESVRRHIGFESLAERSFLAELDRTPGVVGVASQPMWVHWAREDRPPHAPDYFVRLDDGSGVVVDVKPLGRIDQRVREQFDRTAQMCREVGWRYVVFSEDSRVRESNLRFLMRYRHAQWATDDAERRLRGFVGTLDHAVSLLGNTPEAFGHCYSLVWRGALAADLSQPLALTTTLSWEDVR